MNWRGAAASIGVLVKRALNEITRCPAPPSQECSPRRSSSLV